MRAVCERQAIVWDAIERLAFRPRTDKERNTWLSLYERSLGSIWGRHAVDVGIRNHSSFTVEHLGLRCEHDIQQPRKYGVTILVKAKDQKASNPDSICWHLHVDPDYRSRSSLCEQAHKYPKQDMAKHLERDVETVLDGMLFHPRNHAHADKLGIASALGGESELSSYEIRIGGGIENGFVFLTHLRYQFCLLSADTRQNERTRLIRLFADAIRVRRHEKGHPIPPGNLFGLKT